MSWFPNLFNGSAAAQHALASRGDAAGPLAPQNIEAERRVAVLTAEVHAATAQREKAESQLRDSSAQLRVALEAGEIGEWEVDLATGSIATSRLHDRIFGYSEPQHGWDIERFLAHLHADDRDQIRRDFASCVAVSAEWNQEFRILRPDGVVRTLWARGKLVEPTAGKCRRMLGIVIDITELQRAEERAMQLAAIVDSSADAIIGKNLDSIITSWNPGAERMFGYSAAEMVGTSTERLIPLERACEEQRLLDQVKRGLHVDQFETVRICKDRSCVDVSVTMSPIRNSAGEIIAASHIARDVSERNRGQRALEESEARFRQLADSMPDVVWASSPDGVIDYYNHRWFERTGQLENAGCVQDWTAFVHPDDLASSVATWNRSLETGAPRCVDYRLFDARSGAYRWHLGQAVAVHNESGAIVRWYGTETDVHALKTAQADLESSHKTLEQRVQDRTVELAAANEELEAFSYSVSHDLRAPLRAVNGFSRIVAEEHAAALGAEGKRYLQTIQTSAIEMGQLLDDLLAFSRMGRESMKVVDIDTRDLVDSAFATFQSVAQVRCIEFAVHDLPPCRGDLALLRQVWINLLSNALKYTRNCALTSITVGAESSGDTPVFFIRDNGVGFDMKYAGKLFGVFQRLHRSDEFEGTGVGLALVQRIIRRHGGRIWAEAQPNAGATFFFTLGEVRYV
jgi:PAS domain S-box-containing protein